MTKTFTKSQLIDALANRHSSLNKREAGVIVNWMLDTMIDALSHGQRVEIRGFGSFSIRLHGARTGWSPRKGEAVQVKARYVPRFRAGADLKKALNPKPPLK